LRSVELIPTISTVSYGNIVFDLYRFYLRLFFQESNLEVKEGLGVFHLKNIHKRQGCDIQFF
jgi:hypothetical protein